MPIYQQGSLNTTALIVPGLYVQVVPPQNLVLNGVPTNILGVVGTASFGPVGLPVICSSMADYATQFGPILNRKYDAGTQVATAVQQGASNFRVVRATDGTDAAASAVIQSTGITLTALYTGSLGNSITYQAQTGSAATSTKVVIGIPGQVPEVYDNILGAGTNAFWVNLAAAINGGNGLLRPPSRLVSAVAGGLTVTPTLNVTTTLSGGSDGAASVTAAVLVGVDTLPRKGMYALRKQGCSIVMLADADDSTQWSAQVTFGLFEGAYMILVGPAGDSITNAVTVKTTAGIDSYAAKMMFGDWIYWSDQINGVIRLVSPQGFAAGRLANLSPEQSSLNKPLYNVIGTQKNGLPSNQATTYSDAELGALFGPGIDVITNPAPGGSYNAVRLGHNTSSNPATSGDNYTRLTNYIAATLNAGMGVYVGQVINATLLQRVRATLLSYLGNLFSQGQLGSLDGTLPYSVICDISNNPQNRTSIGYVQADIQVQYQGINEKFIVNLEGGQTVVVRRQTVTPSAGLNQPAF